MQTWQNSGADNGTASRSASRESAECARRVLCDHTVTSLTEPHAAATDSEWRNFAGLELRHQESYQMRTSAAALIV